MDSFTSDRSVAAENVLEIHDVTVADRLAAFVDDVRARYPRATPPNEG